MIYDEFDIELIKFVYQTPYLLLVIIEIIKSTIHEISHLVLMTNRESPNTSILLTFKSITFQVACGHHSMRINEEIANIYSLCIPRNIKV